MNKSIVLDISHVVVMLGHGVDKIRIYATNLPYAMIYDKPSNDCCILEIETPYNEGIKYVLDNFGIEPSIINVRDK